MYNNDPRTVITLDAGGTHFRFSAMRGCEAVTETFELPTHPNDLAQLLEDLRNGFQHIIDRLCLIVNLAEKSECRLRLGDD